MAEKRRLSARDRREPAAKRRVSEAPPQSQSQSTSSSSKRKASAGAVAPTPTPPPPPVQVVENPLPTKIKDGEGLPIVPSPQPETLSAKEYQSIAESAVLLTSLERSKKKWLSDGILVRYWTKPKKTKREQIESKNPPKETMSKVGPCNIAVGPHLFDAMLYTVKDPNAPPPIQYTPPQRPMVHYGHPNNFQQYQPYNTPPQHARQHPPQNPPAHSASPQPAYHQSNHPQPPQPTRTSNQPAPQRPSQSAQRPSPSQQPQTQPPKPSPDPVIQMLATRAASDPDLKALMRVVASSKASQEQLRAFQAHIDELNAIIRAREQQQQQQRQQQSHPSTPNQAHASPRTPQQTPQLPQPSQQQSHQQQNKSSTPSQQPAQARPQDQTYPRVEVHVPKPPPSLLSTPQTPNGNAPNQSQNASRKSNATPQVKQEPGAPAIQRTPAAETPANVKQSSPAVRPMAPPQNQPAGSRPGPPYPPYQQPPYQSHTPAIQSRPPQYGSPASYYRPAPPPPPPRLNYKSVVFEFTSPLTPYGSSTSGHAGSGDRYLFPEHTILEWLPDGNTVLASFLLVRKVDPNTPFPIETASEVTNSRTKGKSASRSKKGDKSKDKEKEKNTDKTKEGEKSEKERGESNAQTTTGQTASATDSKQQTPTEGEKPAGGQADQTAPLAMTPSQSDSNKPQSKDKPEDATKAAKLKEYYQPVTFRIHSPNPKVLEPLSRVVKPADEVRKYMNEIMDRAERAPDGLLAFRLPREKLGDELDAEEKKKGGTPAPANRSHLSKGRAVDEESDIENREELVEGEEEEEEEEEELKDYYGPPSGLVPLGL
ncbi:hypothetical protein BDV28DRAFT_128524 [Aspergillus coremiiformis]|uniref:SWR1-complex protein 3 domain-containing protein n=1 Tax=Aspergillus coremiiformis TaxID=138285 RepID=A0A5N6ZEJ8_9EURO|nr:hypothetical protein BDV28DRAFT_128524 [Aspergillus coremiiformis]